MVAVPRVAFFSDSFHEVNGVALTSREFQHFAVRRGLPFFSVHTGPRTQLRRDGECWTFELANSVAALRVERDLAFDLAFARHLPRLYRALKQFQPDLIHVTGPSHIGILGAILARLLRVPKAASWHTNLHEYAEQRLERKLAWISPGPRHAIASWAGRSSLNLALRFFELAKVLFAPNPELVDLLAARTGRPAFLMQRGIDTALFSPERRDRTDGDFVIGFVGRLSPEKNVRLLADVEKRLRENGVHDCRFLIVGDGAEAPWLKANLHHAQFTGVLTGEALARAYANMDVFLFPSETDTFGNVVLEAMASGVPVLVSKGGGPKYLVRSRVNGFVAQTFATFVEALLDLRSHPWLRKKMGEQARVTAMEHSWDRVFETVYDRYGVALACDSPASDSPASDSPASGSAASNSLVAMPRVCARPVRVGRD